MEFKMTATAILVGVALGFSQMAFAAGQVSPGQVKIRLSNCEKYENDYDEVSWDKFNCENLIRLRNQGLSLREIGLKFSDADAGQKKSIIPQEFQSEEIDGIREG